MDWEDVRAQRHATTQSALEMYGNVTQRKTILHVLKVGKVTRLPSSIAGVLLQNAFKKITNLGDSGYQNSIRQKLSVKFNTLL